MLTKTLTSARKSLHRLALALAGAAAMVSVAACGTTDTSADRGAGGANTANMAGATNPSAPLHSSLPPGIARAGILKVASYAGFPPFESFTEDGKTIVGLDVDLARALSGQLGVGFQFSNASFDAIIPGLQAKRYDIAMSAMSDTKERQRQVDFVDYAMGGSAILVAAANPHNVATVDDLCGKTVGVHKGTTDVEDAAKISEQCKSRGHQPINQVVYPNDGQMILALQTNRADCAFTDAIAGPQLIAGSNNSLKMILPPFNKMPFGIVIPKESSQLTQAIQRALTNLRATGEYQKIFEHYNLPEAALADFPINGATG